MKISFVFTLSIIFLLLTPSCIKAASYYVATTGNDSNPGTQTQPYKTIQKGADVAQAGDTVFIRGGTYTDGLIVIKNSGSPGAYITFTNYNNENVIIDDTWLPASVRYWDSSLNEPAAMIHIVGKSYIKISGLNLINHPPTIYCNNPPQSPLSNCIDGDANKGFSPQYGIRIVSKFIGSVHEDTHNNPDWVESIVSPADHITIENNHIEETKNDAIAIWTGSTNVTLDGNTIVNPQNDHANGATGSDHEGIDFMETSNFEAKNNHISYNGRLDNHGNPFWGVPGGILLAVAGGRHLNMTTTIGSIHNNFITNSPQQGSLYIDGEKNGISHVDVYNNYFYNSTGISIAAECGATVSDIRIFNNVINYSNQWGIGINTTNNCYDAEYKLRHPPIVGNGLKKNISIFNNTIFGTFRDGGRGIWITTSALENIQIKNNIVAFVPVSQNDIAKAHHTPVGYPPYDAIYTAQITRLAVDSMGGVIPANQIYSSNNLIVNKAIYPPISQLTVCDTCSEVALPGSIVADPKFIKSTIGVTSIAQLPMDYTENFSDLHLTALSPAINTAINSMVPLIDFDNVTRPQGAGYDIGAYEYTSSTPIPTATPGITGDLNHDGVVNIQDFILLSNDFNKTGTGLVSDLNNDQVVNIQDFILLSNNFGKT